MQPKNLIDKNKKVSDLFFKIADEIVEKAKKEKRLIINPSIKELRKLLERGEGVQKTRYGNFNVLTEPQSRGAIFTKNNVDDEFGEEEIKLAEKCEKAFENEKVLVRDVKVGVTNKIVRLVTFQKYPHLAYGLANSEKPIDSTKKPDYYIIVFTDENFEKNKKLEFTKKDITIRLAFFEDKAIKIIRNSTYLGEVKKGVFSFEDYFAKKEGNIFLHAGCRQDYLQQVNGEYKEVVSLIAALSGNGKTTLTSKILAVEEKEKSWLVQDDGGTLTRDGRFIGFESKGMYVKTENIKPGEQLEIYYGLLKPATLLENVYINEEGEPDFFDVRNTSNGRGVVRRRDFLHASKKITVDKVDNFFLITRGSIIPAVSKLSTEEAAALMIVGMAEETSAGNPAEAGKLKSEFFYDPFVVGSKVEHANRFYEICKKIGHINFYYLNTGGIGPAGNYHPITVRRTVRILDAIIRGELPEEGWEASPFGFKVPKNVKDVDDIYFHPEKLFRREEYTLKLKRMYEEYNRIIEGLGSGLRPEVKKALDKNIK